MLSGIDARAFTFMGFLGKQNKEIRGGIEKIAASENTVILYETPHRLVKNTGSYGSGHSGPKNEYFQGNNKKI